MKKTTIPTLGGAMLAATLFFAGPVSAEEWNMATPYPENNFHTQNDIQFAKDVAEATDGKLQITVHSAGSLIAHPEIRNAVRNGTVPLGEILMSMLSNESPVYEVDAIPFLIENYDDAQRLWDASRGQVEDMFAKQNMMVLYSVPWPANGIYTTKPIETASDFNGMKMRVYSAVTEQIAQKLGAVPTQIAVPDIPQAFSTGRVDAMITSAATGVNVSAWDFLDHYYDVKVSFAKTAVLINKRMFDQLDEATKKAVLDAAAKAEKRGWEMSQSDDVEMVRELDANGVKVEEPSEELAAQLRQIGDEIFENWKASSGEAGQAILDAYQK